MNVFVSTNSIKALEDIGTLARRRPTGLVEKSVLHGGAMALALSLRLVATGHQLTRFRRLGLIHVTIGVLAALELVDTTGPRPPPPCFSIPHRRTF